MSYYTQSQLAQDHKLRQRIAACAAKEGVSSPHPTAWADDAAWALAAQPGWDDAYAYALNSGNADPTVDGAVISDGMILAAVQARLADQAGEDQ